MSLTRTESDFPHGIHDVARKGEKDVARKGEKFFAPTTPHPPLSDEMIGDGVSKISLVFPQEPNRRCQKAKCGYPANVWSFIHCPAGFVKIQVNLENNKGLVFLPHPGKRASFERAIFISGGDVADLFRTV